MAGNSKYIYTKAVREFAFTLDYYGPRAYEYIREKFNGNLPHISTLRKWYAYSGANGEVGICRESIDTLQKLVNEAKEAGKEFHCSISFDEMFIRRQVQYCCNEKKFSGFVTYGGKDSTNLDVASNAIVFMVNAISKPINFPIAHHFISSLKTEQKADLIKDVITFVSQTNAIIINITCDGYPTNFSSFEYLGASLNPNNLQPYILDPSNNKRINILFDPCHMLKLVRNILKNEGIISDDENKKVKWVHFERLERARVKNNFITHKLTKQHIECDNNKMKVRLAAETLSKSASNSMMYLMDSGYAGFADCEGSARYSSIFNDIFDVFNTGHADTLSNNNNNVLKTPLSAQTAEHVLPLLDKCFDYISNLKLHGTCILETSVKVGYLGFMIDIISLKQIFNDYVKSGKHIHNIYIF